MNTQKIRHCFNTVLFMQMVTEQWAAVVCGRMAKGVQAKVCCRGTGRQVVGWRWGLGAAREGPAGRGAALVLLSTRGIRRRLSWSAIHPALCCPSLPINSVSQFPVPVVLKPHRPYKTSPCDQYFSPKRINSDSLLSARTQSRVCASRTL